MGSTSEVDGEAELHVALRTGTENGVEAEADIRSSEEFPEAAAGELARFVGEHGMIEHVEYFPLKLHCITLAELKALKQPHVELRNAGLAKSVSSSIAKAPDHRYRERARVKKLVRV